MEHPISVTKILPYENNTGMTVIVPSDDVEAKAAVLLRRNIRDRYI